MNSDDDGRSIVMEADVEGSPYLFVNIYAPNRTENQCRFFDKRRLKIVLLTKSLR